MNIIAEGGSRIWSFLAKICEKDKVNTEKKGSTKIANEISEFSQVEGGLYSDQLSAKFASLLETLNSSIVLPVSGNVETSETSMDDFAQIILNVDKAGSL